MANRPNKLALFLAGTIILAAVFWLAFRQTYSSFTPPALPVPNGYDQLIQAAKMIPPRTGFYKEMGEEELATIVEQNKPALKLVQEALQKPCGVPVDWSRDPASGIAQKYLDDVSSLRDLARALSADMRNDFASGKAAEAVPSGLTIFQLGSNCYRGGLMIDNLIGLAIQGVAINELRNVAVQVPETKTEIMAGLLPMLETGEPTEDVLQREIDYIHSGPRSISGMMVRLKAGSLLEPAVQAARQASLRTTTQQRLFLLHLAVNIYHDQNGKWPESLYELAPSILPTIFIDPYSNGAFIYRVENENYLLYSVGQNKRDDGGTGDESGLAADFVDDFILEAPPADQPEQPER